MTDTHRFPLTRFWDPKTHVVYRVFDENDLLLYIGVTCDPYQRFTFHEYQTRWWMLVHRAEVSQEFMDRWDAEDAEALAISTMEPHFNRHYPYVPERARSINLQFSPLEYKPEPNYPAVMRELGLGA